MAERVVLLERRVAGLEAWRMDKGPEASGAKASSDGENVEGRLVALEGRVAELAAWRASLVDEARVADVVLALEGEPRRRESAWRAWAAARKLPWGLVEGELKRRGVTYVASSSSLPLRRKRGGSGEGEAEPDLVSNTIQEESSL